MEHSDDESDFAPVVDLAMKQEIILLNWKPFHFFTMSEEESIMLEDEIREKSYRKKRTDD